VARAVAIPTLRHVLPLVGDSAPEALRSVQPITLESIRRARQFAEGNVDIEVVGARFPDEEVPAAEWMVDAPVLLASSRDVGQFAVPRRLPLLRDVLAGFGDVQGIDGLVLTNTDVGLQPSFYEVVAEILDAGYDAFTINRRSISPVFSADGHRLSQAAVGSTHPGTDCFVLRPHLLGAIDVGRVLMGTRYVAKTLLEELRARATRFRAFSELHLTFHLGDERAWQRTELSDYDAFNREELLQSRARRGRVGGTVTPAAASLPRRPVTPAAPIRSASRPKLVFCAALGRSGTQFVAEMLGSAERVNAGHERTPTMSGPWLRDVAALGLAATYDHRRAKADAIRLALERLPRGVTYVDTSHLFLTMFHDVVLDAFDHGTIRIIDLRRDPVKIARSMYELGWFSDRQEGWREWLLDPVGLGSPLGIATEEVLDPLDAILLHIARNLHERAALRSSTPTVHWVDVDLPRLRTRSGQQAMLRALGLPPLRMPVRVSRRPVNTRVERKRRIRSPIGRDAIQVRIDELLSRFEGRRGLDALREEVRRWR